MSITQSIQPSLFDVPQIVTAGDTARARATDPITSHQAADTSNLADSQNAVLNALAVHKHLAAFELEQVLPVWSPSRIRTALKELEAVGRVRVSDRPARRTPYGRTAQVWEVC